MNNYPSSWIVGPHAVQRCEESVKAVMDDPRGILHMWEAPVSGAQYIMGLDPTYGITGWSRMTRLDGDHKTDNAAFEVFRVNAYRRAVRDPTTDVEKIDRGTGEVQYVSVDKQVAEFFAPIDSVEAARIANIVGRLYRGNADEHCELIYEAFPGPGVLTTQELLRVGYSNLWEWEYIADSMAESTGRFGWRSNQTSQTLLWTRAKRHLLSDRVDIQSPWLLGEYRDAIQDSVRMRAVAASGVHDDLIQAASMAYWAGHKWAYDVEHVTEPVAQERVIDWQNQAPDFEGEYVSVKDRWAAMVDSWE